MIFYISVQLFKPSDITKKAFIFNSFFSTKPFGSISFTNTKFFHSFFKSNFSTSVFLNFSFFRAQKLINPSNSILFIFKTNVFSSEISNFFSALINFQPTGLPSRFTRNSVILSTNLFPQFSSEINPSFMKNQAITTNFFFYNFQSFGLIFKLTKFLHFKIKFVSIISFKNVCNT